MQEQIGVEVALGFTVKAVGGMEELQAGKDMFRSALEAAAGKVDGRSRAGAGRAMDSW